MLFAEKGHQPVDRSLEDVHDDDHPLFGTPEPAHYVPGSVPRAQLHRRPRRKKRRKVAPILAILVIVALIAVSWVLIKGVSSRFAVADYSGSGPGLTSIQIHPGDGADDVGNTLFKAGVVKSVRAFLNAAKASGQSSSIQPGVYQVHTRSSGKIAMAAILDPANKLQTKVTIPEGFTAKQVIAALSKQTKLSVAELTAAANKIGNLGLPDGMSAKVAEGFLFPATYDFEPGMSPDAVIQTLTANFTSEYQSIGFANGAKALHITPYQALIVASLVESEAKFPQDRPKIARVIYNRLSQNIPIGIDAANRYGVALTGKDPNTTTFEENSPYNVRKHTGLPPTPISNPGEASLKSAIAPAQGDWIYYVVSDAAGHHLFTDNEAQWQAAVEQCRANGWGC